MALATTATSMTGMPKTTRSPSTSRSPKNIKKEEPPKKGRDIGNDIFVNSVKL
jgi:hypothetical protein